ncbi:NCS2 family permease [Pseudoramibacter sp.]|jgi:AGZA family xanthine/uracil permease-like MFS transporter|uniref:NCS2 family permease n=1 Tax=Pseudoramibacter sp. TaxID=2034862 RepID=UPI0025ED0662|nr:NCS2 family permease [Pseudoramibacter sp.]MCH4072298.1 NCS2 family permease [Pseudoramibacter sp.]MCH4106069.1 NCS2 family permease [Pseudoramibacter sp.]
MKEKIAKWFHFDEYGTNLRTEITAGFTTFMGMAYILAVNPTLLSAAGMDKGAVFTTTAVASAIATLVMALLTNYPFALAPGMGLNAYFAYTVCIKMGYSWQVALAAVFIEGIIFIVLSLTNVREALFNAIPQTLRLAISAGIGLFIAMVGFEGAHIVVKDSSTLVTMFKWSTNTNPTLGLTVALALLGTVFTGFLLVRGVRGGVLWGILATWGAGIVCQLLGFYVPAPKLGLYSLIPDFSGGVTIASMAPTFMKMQIPKFSFDFLTVIFAFLFVDLFDTLGTLTGCAVKAGYIDENGKLPRITGALLADAIGTAVGACLGTSTVTTFVESSLGISEGGRSGLVGIIVAALFLVSLFFSPIFLAIPSFATAPALIVVGFLMIQNVVQIDFYDPTEGIPAFLCLAFMPMTYSISEGIGVGFISYTIINLLAGKKDKVSITMIVVSVLYILKYIFV